jgi:hypothetical protein
MPRPRSSPANSIRRPRFAARRHFRPRVEALEDRRPLAAGIFVEDFSSDADPTQPGFDSDADGFRIAHQFSAPPRFTDVSNTPSGPGGDFFSAPHGVFINAIDRITFPDMLADEFINLARVNVSIGAFGSYVRFIARDGRFLTVNLQPQAAVRGIIATSQTPADDGLPLGQITEMEIRGIELIMDDVRVLVTRNFAPEPQDDLAIASPREVISIPVLANDLSSNFDPLTIIAVTTPPRGQVAIDGDAILYVSDQGFTGEDMFEYTVQDTFGETATATVRVQVIGPAAVNDRALTLPGVPVEIDVLENDTTPGGDDLLTIIGTSDPPGGAAAIVGNHVVYTPDTGFSGSDTFTYTLRDPFRNESTATVIVVVNSPPQAADLSYSLAHGVTGPFTIPAPSLLAGASDPDGPAPAIVPSTALLPFGSVAIAADGSFTISSTRSDALILRTTFVYRVRDEFGFEAVGDVRIDVANTPPSAVDSTIEAVRGAPGPFEGLVGTDADGDSLTAALLGQPRHGVVSFEHVGPDIAGRTAVRFRYDPGPNDLQFNDLFIVRLGDAHDFADATVRIATNNGGSVAQNDAFTMFENTVSTLDILSNDQDADGDPLSARILLPPHHGTLSPRPNGLIAYEPTPGFTGEDVFTYLATDGDLESNPATVVLTVISGVPAATVFDGAFSGPYFGGAFAEDPFARRFFLGDPSPSNIIPPPNTRFVEYLYTVVTQTRVGVVTAIPASADVGAPPLQRSDRGFRFQYPPGFTGTVTFTYAVVDADRGAPPGPDDFLASNIAAVSITIFDTDSDGDGVSNSIEDITLPNNSDLCDVIIEDGEERLVCVDPDTSPFAAAVPNAVDGRHLIVLSDDGYRLRNVEALADPASGVPLPPGVEFGDFPYGFVGFEIHDLPLVGGTAVVRMVLPSPGPFVTTYYKFGPEPDNLLTPQDERVPHWYEFLFDGTTGAELLGDVVVLHFVDGGRGDDDLAENGVIVDPGGSAFVPPLPPQIDSVVINDGHPQRSKINRLTVTFDGPVTIDPGAFELRRHGTKKPIETKFTLSQTGGRTVALLTFKGAWVQYGTLKEGNYTLTVRAAKIRNATGDLLDGDGDGIAGGNYVDEFFRRFGDSDGDGDVDTADKRVFTSAYGKRSWQTGYLWYLDFNANGRIGSEDLAHFILNKVRHNNRP